MLVLWEDPRADLVGVGLERVPDLAREVRVALDEAGQMPLRQSEQVAAVDESFTGQYLRQILAGVAAAA